MSAIPAFEIGVWNAWWFMCVFLLQWLAVLIIPKNVAERTGHPAELKLSRAAKISGSVTQIFWIGATLYSIFLPFQTGTAWLYTGLAAFTIGVIILVYATVMVFRTQASEPFTGGVYRISRHPMYLSMMFIYAGVSIAAASWLFLVITVITFFLQRYQIIQEEAYCQRKFGASYNAYMERTPRWIGIPKPG
jgi:protein-S-isoprenylcysteine O-methyltransferase Ste14